MGKARAPSGRKEITLPDGWAPRPYQRAAWNAAMGVRGPDVDGVPTWLVAPKNRHSLAWHRRAGKDAFALNRTAVAAFERVGTYWHMLPQANQARKAIWDAVDELTGIRRIDQAFPLELRETTRDHEMFIRFKNGSTWQVVGSDNYNALVGSPPIGVVYSEYAMADPASWGFLRPILANNGGWAMFISTPRGQNHFAKLHRAAMTDPTWAGDWFAQTLTVQDTGAISAETIARELRELAAERGDTEARAIVDQEYFCFPSGTPVTTARGQVGIEAVQAGDTVLTHTGRWRPVKRLYSHEHVGEVVEIAVTGLPTPILCTPNHPIRVADPHTQTFRWVPAGEVAVGEYAVLPRVRTAEPFVSAATAEAVAWFIAEGSFAKTCVQITLGHDEQAFAERVVAAFSPWGSVAVSAVGPTLQCQVKSAAAADFMLTHCGSAAAGKRIPWALIRGHEELVYRTLMDGDGCRGNYGGVDAVYTTVSHTLALDMQMLAHTLGFRASVSRRHGGKATIEGRVVKTQASYAVRVNEKPATGSTQRIRPMKNGIGARVKSVTRSEFSGPVFNIGVQHDESYVAGGIVVHNCSFDAALPGAYFGELLRQKEQRGEIGSFPWVPGVPVRWGSDLGMGDSTTFWLWQDIGGRARLINFLEGSGVEDVGWYVNRLNEWPYTYGKGMLPHDGGHNRLGMAGSIAAQMARLGKRADIVPRTKDLTASIQQTRQFLVGCVINTDVDPLPGESRTQAGERMTRALEGLRMYHRKWNEQAQRFDDHPTHDWSSNIADGLRTVACGYRPSAAQAGGRPRGEADVRIADGT